MIPVAAGSGLAVTESAGGALPLPAVLVLKKKGVSRSYRLFDDDHEIGLVQNDAAWRTGKVEIDGRMLEFSVAGAGDTTFSASIDGVAAATASWPDTSLRAYDVEAGGAHLHMDMPGIGQRPFDVTDADGGQLGVVALRGAMGRRIEIDLPADISMAGRLLCGWLATRNYNNAANVRLVVP